VDFGRVFVKTIQYPNFYRDKTFNTPMEKVRTKYGWWSSRDKKEQLLGILRRAYACGGIINHSGKALDEALSYVRYDDGGIGPAELSKEAENARLTHGDRVIADALCLLGVEDAPRPTDPVRTTPMRSVAFRRKIALEKFKARPGLGTKFDFTSGRPEFSFGRR
jgi:hypothetical protein